MPTSSIAPPRPSKFSQKIIFGMKICHLATLLQGDRMRLRKKSPKMLQNPFLVTTT
jgi:hypothetical protein